MTENLIRSGDLGLGWNRDREDFGYLSAPEPLLMAAPTDHPLIVDPEPWILTKNQGPMGSCEGHANSSVGEFCNLLGTAGEYTRFSPMFTYLQSQIAGGNFGTDSGAMIAAGVSASRIKGYAREETFPYPSRYTTRIPDAAVQEAGQHLIRQHTPMRSAGDCFAYLANLLGGILIGIDWTTGLANSNGYITLSNCGGNILGGHALCLLGYRVDTATGELWFKMLNSHGRQWGLNGWAWVHTSVVDHWIKSNTYGSFVGLSDLQVYERRILDVSQAA